MELLIIIALIIVLGVLAQRFGADSRDGLRTSEADFAALGMAWAGPPSEVLPSAATPSAEWVVGADGLHLAWHLEESASDHPITELPVATTTVPKAA